MSKTRKSKVFLPSTPSFSHFKDKCICCEETGRLMNKEHIFPQWLLKRTKSEKVLLNSPYGKIPGNQLTVPLCIQCNTCLGEKLEGPVSRIFNDLEHNYGINDHEAELLIRWMWKMQGMFYWSICNDNWKYGFSSLRERVLNDIVAPRSRISIGIALVEDEYDNGVFGYAPVGLDSFPLWSNVYSVGVFSKISIVVFYTKYIHYINTNLWTVYTLNDNAILVNPSKLVFPKVTFKTGSEAITKTSLLLGNNSPLFKAHERIALLQHDEYFKGLGIHSV